MVEERAIGGRAMDTRASLRRDGDALVFTGALLRSEVATLWPRAMQGVVGARRFDLRAVDRIDSAGLAFLAELAELGSDIVVDGTPAGLTELSAAYRLSASLAFAH